MNQKRALSFVGLFIIALVVSLPFYVADVYATSVSITKNQGSGGIEGFIDGEGDVWTVEATITGYEWTVEADDVKIRIGANEAEFNSCSDSALGTACEYVSPLDDGVREGGYDFDVLFYYLDPFEVIASVGDSDTIVADGSGPEITFNSVKQEGGEVKLDFSVKDEPGLCVGLEKVEISDVEGGILQTVNGFEEGDCDYNFAEDGGVLGGSLTGEGRKSLKVEAVDKLGHEASKTKSFDADFVAPVIDDEVVFVSFGEFIGQYEAMTDIQVNVTENGDDLTARAYSEQAELDGDEVECEPIYEAEEEGLWSCTWENVDVIPTASISVRIEAEDGAGNTAERTLSKSFVVDNSPPEAVFFGTERTFDDVSYVKEGTNRIVLNVREEGAGIEAEGIRAGLGGLGGEDFDAPDYFNESTYEAYWDVTKRSFATDTVLVGLSYFKDRVGNEGHKPEIEVQVDTDGPDVEEIEIYGLSEAGKKDYFQSNDVLSIEMEIGESNGLLVLVDLNDVVMDAETVYPEFSFGDLGDYSGWAMFTEEDCLREEGKWICALETEAVKSGYDRAVDLTIEVYDTAGNAASWLKEPKNVESGDEGEYKLELLGLDVEEEPDFWEVKRVGYAPSFIDLDTTGLINTRVAAKVELNSDGATARKIDLIGCSPAEEANVSTVGLTRNLVYGGESEQTDKATPTIVLEFETFDRNETFGAEIGAAKESGEFRTVSVPYICQLKIYSQVRKKAIKTGEVQEVELLVDFGFSVLGAQDENLEEIIKKEKEAVSTGFWGAIGTLETVFKWTMYIAQVLSTVTSFMGILEGPSKTATDSFRATKIGVPAAIAICFGLNSATQSTDKIATYLRVPLQILTCQSNTGIGWYDTWVGFIPNYYNQLMDIEMLKLPGDYKGPYRPARGVYDNFYLSLAAFCIPGIIHNLDKYRQIKCRKIYCLENEVKNRLATVETCNELEGLMTCKYFIGELWYIFPFSQFWDKIVGALWTMIKDPIALAYTATIVTCGTICLVNSRLSGTCNLMYFIWNIIHFIDSTVALGTQIYQDIQTGGLQYCDMVSG